MQEEKDFYKLKFSVRDYECDLQGIVNNAQYQHYLEHTRHQFLISRGISFAGLHKEGTDLIVTRIEIDYKYPLKSQDHFIVTLNLRRKGNVRVVFEQDIFRIPDRKHIISAVVTGVVTRNGHPVSPVEVLKKIELF
jgi:acyl-CoA thioester hydrolase